MSTNTAHRLAPPDEYRTFIGIDPGISGGVAVLGNNPLLPPWVAPTPTIRTGKGNRREIDRDKALEYLNAFTNRFAAIERVNAAPMRGRKQGAAGMFNFGQGYGLWLGIFQALGIPYVEVWPRAWKKAVLKGLGFGTDKDGAVAYVRRFHPTVELRATPRCRTSHTGLADAVCLAEYARREWAVRSMVAGATGERS